MRRCSMLLGLALVVAPAHASAAEEVAFRLDYKPVRGCMDLDTLALFLEGDFGYRVVHDDARALVRIAVKGSGRKLEAQVSALDDVGVERWQAVIPGPIDCRELMQDTAYAISLNLGKWELKKQAAPAWLLRGPTVEVGMSAPSPPLRAFVALGDDGPLRVRTPDPLYTVTTSAEAPTGPRWEIGGSVLSMPYGLPRVGFGGALALTVRWSKFSLHAEARGIASLTQEDMLPERTVLLGGVLMPCLETSMRLGICSVLGAARTVFDVEGSTWSDHLVITSFVGPRLHYSFEVGSTVRIRPFGEALLSLGASPLTYTYGNGATASVEPLSTVLLNFGVSVAFVVD